jgi:tRNA G10  N-methylase Trm11
MYLFLTTKEHLPLAKEEITTLFNKQPEELKPGLYLLHLSLDSQAVEKQATRLGFCTCAYEIKKTIKGNNVATLISTLREQDVEEHYKLEQYTFRDLPFSQKELVDAFYEQTGKKIVNLTTLYHCYAFFFLENTAYFTKQCYRREDKPQQRRSHLQKHNHPTSIHPKIARCMTVLGNSTTFHDPFCGVGGIVIEGALAGLMVSGSDISKQLITYAKERAESQHVEATFFVKNALDLQGNYQVYISDLPYGRNSTLTTQRNELYETFLLTSKEYVKRLVLCFPAEKEIERLIKQSPWTIQFSYTFRVHKSLSRQIFVLE